MIKIFLITQPRTNLFTWKHLNMSAVHPSLQLLHVQLLLPVLTAIEFTLQTTGCSTNLMVLRLNISILIENAMILTLCMSVEMAGSSTKGTRKRKAKMQTIQRVPRTSEM